MCRRIARIPEGVALVACAVLASPARADPPVTTGTMGTFQVIPRVAPQGAVTSTFDAPPPAVERISFSECMRRALARNLTVTLAAAEVRRAAALAEQIRAGSMPTLFLNGGYTRLDADRVFNGRLVAGANQFAGNVVLSLPLVMPQRWVQWSHARENVDLARASQADVRRTVAANAGHAYITVSSQHRILAAIERARDNARAHLAFARARFEGGVGNRIDAVRAAQEVAADELQMAGQRMILARQQAILGTLLGVDHPVDAVDDASVASAPLEARALDAAMHRRADVQAGQLRLRAAEHVRDDSWVDFLPTVLATFQPFYQNPPSLVQPEWGWQAQVLLSVPVFDGGLRYGARHERDILVDEARTTAEALLRQVRVEVRTAYEALRQAETAAAASHASAVLAAEALGLAEEAYRAGATTNIEVVDAQRRARDADATAFVTDDSVRQARLDLLLAVGENWGRY